MVALERILVIVLVWESQETRALLTLANKVTWAVKISLYYTSASKNGGGGIYCFTSVHQSFRPSLTNIFHHLFLSNHASQAFQTWDGALAGDPTSSLLNLCPPVIYFLFYVYSNKTWLRAKFSVALFSATMHHSHFKLGMVVWLGVQHITHGIYARQLSTSCFTT